MSQPIHTQGPVRVFSPFGRPEIVTDRPTAHETQSVVTQFGQPNADANARLLAAAYNAFDSAARVLNCNAVELAEGMQEGLLAELLELLGEAHFELIAEVPGKSNTVKKIERLVSKVKGGAS